MWFGSVSHKEQQCKPDTIQSFSQWAFAVAINETSFKSESAQALCWITSVHFVRVGQTHTNAHCYWEMLYSVKTLRDFTGRNLYSPFSLVMPMVSSNIFVKTYKFCNDFAECLQFPKSTADCLLMLLPLGSGVLWIGCFFTFILYLHNLKKTKHQTLK